MRLLTALFLSVMSTSTFATDIDTYQGKNYASSRGQECQQDFAQITQRLESHSGFKIIQGGCLAQADGSLQLSFSYAHPLIYPIEQLMNRQYDSVQLCEAAARGAEAQFKIANVEYLAAYCRGNELLADYLDFGHNVMVESYSSLSFLSAALCQNHLAELANALRPHGVSMLFPNCRQVALARDTLYVPESNLLRLYSDHVGFINGKTLGSGESCLSERTQIADKFKRAQMTLVHATCVAPKWGGGKYELLTYVSTENSPHVRTLNGNAVYSRSECEQQLLKAVSGLESLGHKELYKFCQDSYSGYFTPVVYYTQDRIR